MFGIFAFAKFRYRHFADSRQRCRRRAGYGCKYGAADDIGMHKGRREAGPSTGDRPRNMSSDKRVRYRISPIQMNKGSAVKVQEDEADQMVVSIASPGGREVNSSIPT